MSIQQRRGANADFDATKMLPGELAVTTDGTRKVYVAFAPGDAREFAFKDQIPIVGDVTPDKLQEAVDNYLNENPVHAGATEEEAKQIELNRQNIEANDEAIKEVGEEVEKTNTNVAQLSNPNLFINGNFQIWSNGESFEVYGTNNEEFYATICDRWCAKHYDIMNEYVLSKHPEGLLFTSASEDTCCVYQQLDESTFSALIGEIVTLSWSYTDADGVMQTISNNLVVDEERDIFTMKTRLYFTNGCVLHWVKLEVGELATPCLPDTKDAIICKLEKDCAMEIGQRKMLCMMSYIGRTDCIYYSTPYYFKKSGTIRNVTINSITVEGEEKAISESAKNMVSAIVTNDYVYFCLNTENTLVINELKGKVLNFDVNIG